MTKLILLDSLLQEVCIKCMWDYIAHSYSGIVSLESQWSSTILCFYLVCMHTQYLWLMPKYWLNTIFVADANILAEYWHEPNDTIYWEGPLSCGMYGTIAQFFSKIALSASKFNFLLKTPKKAKNWHFDKKLHFEALRAIFEKSEENRKISKLKNNWGLLSTIFL